MSEPLVRYAVEGVAAVITLNRPAKRNALSRALLRELLDSLRRAGAESAVRVVLLAAEGPAFCAGMDLEEMRDTRKLPGGTARRRMWKADARQYKEVIDVLLGKPLAQDGSAWMLGKPVIAAVGGAAVAGGAGLVLAADVVVASEQARFGVPEVRRGLVAGLVEPLLVLRAGGGAASYLLLTGKMLDAREAKERGIFHEVVPVDRLTARAHELVAEVALGAPDALSFTRSHLQQLVGMSFDRQMELGAAVSGAVRATDEAAEGLAAFVGKRKPRWPLPSSGVSLIDVSRPRQASRRKR